MMKHFYWRISLTFLCLLTGFASAQQLAFPGAEGYGRFASGGRGNGETGRVVEVTNLEDDMENPPEGSIRWALDQGIDIMVHPLLGNIKVKRPLTIVFKVGGVINLKGDLRSQRDNLTIAGQTAPGDGICFRGGTLIFGGSKNVIIRYIRSRPGDELGEETSAFRIENGENFIVDHCSFSWAIEETTHFSSSPNFTVQWCIISESFYRSIHKKGERGYGSQHGGMYASYHHNLMAHHNSRTPRINGSNENDVEALVDYRNNVNYNWGNRGALYGGEWMKTFGKGFAHTNIVNNYFVPGPATSSGVYFARPSRGDTSYPGYSKWCFNGNVMKGYSAMSQDNWLGVDESYVGSLDSIRSDDEFIQSDGVLENYNHYTQSAEDAYNAILEGVGATLPKRDVIDARVIAELKGEIPIVRYAYTDSAGQVSPVKGLTSGLIDTQWNLVPDNAPIGTTPWDVYSYTEDVVVDTDHDGIPDAWEIEKGLNKDDVLDGRLIADNGYSNFENYLYGLNSVANSLHKTHKTSVRIYPNPITDKFFIECSERIGHLELINSAGKTLKTLYQIGEGNEFDISDVSTGCYIVKGTFNNGDILVEKVLKK